MGAYWQPAVSGDFALTILAIDVVIDGFTFWGGALAVANGISAVWGAPVLYGENTIIRNCTFSDDLTIGIQLEYVWFALIHNNHFQECATGIYIDPAGSGAAHLQIFDNWFQDCPTAAMNVNGLDNSLIYRNNIYNAAAQSAAVATNQGIDTTAGQQNIVSGNFFSCLLPVPANGDIDDFCTAAATDAYCGNFCLNGLLVSNPT
jgi:nitrous oxidase accessory protein NosD